MTNATFSLDISGMSCAACAQRIERVLARHPDIAEARVDFAQERAAIRLNAGVAERAGTAEALELIRHAGYHGFPRGGSTAERQARREARERARKAEFRLLTLRAILGTALALPFLVAMVYETATGSTVHLLPIWYQVGAASIAQSLLAWPFYRGAWAALRAGGSNMDVLVVLGTLTAYLLSLRHVLDGSIHHGAPLYFEGAVAVIAFVLAGKVIEKRARREAGAALSALSALLPEHVSIRDGAGDRSIERAALQPGMLVVVKPGQIVPVDGIIREGEASLDESSITGESLPVRRKVGEPVQSGSAVSGGALAVEAMATGDETRLARLARLIEDADGGDATRIALVDRISGIFVPAVLGLALASFAYWWGIGAGGERALVIASSVLVVACPCALGLATPIALVAGANAAARQGLIIADLSALEAGAGLTHLALDKTGTLTIGRPSVATISASGSDENLALALAAGLARQSDHPLDAAIVAEAKARGVEPAAIGAFSAQAGGGLAGTFEGAEIRLGSLEFAAPGAPAQAAALVASLPADYAESPAALLSRAGEPLALFAFADPPRPEAAAMIAAVKALGIEPVMLSGDRPAVAAATASRLGIESVRGGLKPADKVVALATIRAQGAVLGFVGDGLNDGPALSAAHVGLAMGTGTEVAKGAAKVVLARPDLALVARFIRLARRTRQAVRENLALAFLFNIIAIPLAMAGMLSPAIAGAAMALSSVSVVLNALRLARWQG